MAENTNPSAVPPPAAEQNPGGFTSNPGSLDQPTTAIPQSPAGAEWQPVSPAQPPVSPYQPQAAPSQPGGATYQPATAGQPGATPQWGQPPAQLAVEPPEGWQAAYQRARGRSQIFMATTAIAGVLAFALGAWGVAQAVTSGGNSQLASQNSALGGPGLGGGSGGLGQGRGMGDGPDAGTGQGGPGGSDVGGAGMGPLGQLFNSDGSLNETVAASIKSHLANDPEDAQMISNMLTRGVTAGVITQDQANKALTTLGITGSTTATPEASTSTSTANSA